MLTYLSIPYSHSQPEIQEYRFEIADRVATVLRSIGHMIFSPISHSHLIVKTGELPTDWESYDRRTMLKCCNQMVVIGIDGWKESQDVKAEIDIAKEMNIPITLIDPITCQIVEYIHVVDKG